MYRAGKDGSLNELCSECLRKLELCLEHDVRICREQSAAVVSSVFGSSSGSGDKPPAAPGDLLLLPPDLVLKLAALSILPSYSLRQLGECHEGYARNGEVFQHKESALNFTGKVY